MQEHLVRVRFDYEQEIVRRRCRNPEQHHFFDFEFVVVREVDGKEAPIAYRVFDVSEGAHDRNSFVIRSYGGGFWWPVEYGFRPLTPDAFMSLVDKGDRSIVGALGASPPFARQTLEEFSSEGLIRRIGISTLKEQQLSLSNGARRTLFCEGRVYFEAGPPAFFRGRYRNMMDVGPCGIGPDQFGNDSFKDCRIPGPARHDRCWSAATGQALDPDEIETWRMGMPGWTVLADIEHRIVALPCLAPPGSAALFCEREFPKKLRAVLSNDDADPDCVSLLGSHDPQLLDWIQSPMGHECDRQILRRFAESRKAVFEIPFDGEIKAARAILKRLKHHGLATDLDEADDAALAEIGGGLNRC